jgi:hypothetical protein
VNENSLFGDRDDHIVLEKIANEVLSGCFVDIRGREAGRISVLCDQLGFELYVIVCCIIDCI